MSQRRRWGELRLYLHAFISHPYLPTSLGIELRLQQRQLSGEISMGNKHLSSCHSITGRTLPRTYPCTALRFWWQSATPVNGVAAACVHLFPSLQYNQPAACPEQSRTKATYGSQLTPIKDN